MNDEDNKYSNKPHFLQSDYGKYNNIDNSKKIINNENIYEIKRLLNLYNITKDHENKKNVLEKISNIRTSFDYSERFNDIKIKSKTNYFRLKIYSYFVILLTLILIITPIVILVINKFPNNLLHNDVFKSSLYILIGGSIVLLGLMFYNIYGKLFNLIKWIILIDIIIIMSGIIMYWSVSYKLNILENYIGFIFIFILIVISILLFINGYYTNRDIKIIKFLDDYNNIDKDINSKHTNLMFHRDMKDFNNRQQEDIDRKYNQPRQYVTRDNGEYDNVLRDNGGYVDRI